MARLNTTIHVYDGTETIVYRPGQEVPQKHREQITAPGVWEDGPDVPEPTVQKVATEEVAEPESTDAFTIPPKAGRGSSVEAWRTYAGEAAERAGLTIEFDADATRADIIEALSEANIPVE